MKWSIWNRRQSAADPKAGKLPKPKELPTAVGRHMVVNLNWDPDEAWRLKAVFLPRMGDSDRPAIRIYDPDEAFRSRIEVKNYRSLDAHPELIVFEGWFDRSSNEIDLHPVNSSVAV
jgi:hypothetical protein